MFFFFIFSFQTCTENCWTVILTFFVWKLFCTRDLMCNTVENLIRNASWSCKIIAGLKKKKKMWKESEAVIAREGHDYKCCVDWIDLDEFWWSRRKPSYALTCWLLFSSFPLVKHSHYVAKGWKTKQKFWLQAQHSALSSPWCDDTVYSSAIFLCWLGELESSLICSINKVHVTCKAQSPL